MDAEQRLRDKLAEISARIEEWSEDDILDEEDEAAMVSRCEAANAPLGWQSLYNRVQRGTLTWQRVWSQPREVGPEAVSLVKEITMSSMQSSMTSLQQSLKAFADLDLDK